MGRWSPRPDIYRRNAVDEGVLPGAVRSVVSTVTPYVRFEDALAALNDSELSAAGILTRRRQQIFQAYRETGKVGAVLANEIPRFAGSYAVWRSEAPDWA